VKFFKDYDHVMTFNDCDFHENPCSERYASFERHRTSPRLF